jgi:hypothetical protein
MIAEQLASPSPRSWLPGAPGGLELVARVGLSVWVLPIDERCRKADVSVRRLARLVLVARRALGAPQPGIGALRRWRPQDLQEDLRRSLEAIDVGSLDLPGFAVVHRRSNPGSLVGVPAHVPDLEADPLRAMALLSRVSGRVFVARRAPRVSALLAAVDEHWIYAGPADCGKEVKS